MPSFAEKYVGRGVRLWTTSLTSNHTREGMMFSGDSTHSTSGISIRLLLAAGLAISDLNIGQHFRATREISGPIFGTWASISQPWILRDEGQEILIDPPDVKLNEDIEFKFQVAFDEKGVAEGESMKIVLRQMLDWVFGVVSDLERFLP